jgi:subtilisin family serine protease
LPKYPDLTAQFVKARGDDDREKLSPELALLYDQFSGGRAGDGRQYKFDGGQLSQLFNISGGGARTFVGVAIKVNTPFDVDDLKTHQAKIYFQADDMVFADVPVHALVRLAGEKSVQSVSATKAAQVPPFSQAIKSPAFAQSPGVGATRGALRSSASNNSPTEFAAGNLNGKGVIVGVIDTGIDWKHQDFIKPDGTSRILYLWDMTDDSFAESTGQIGTQPPNVEDSGSPGPGTLYTNEQINHALQGRGTVNSVDNFGHGTAAAGTAAGNGRATANGVPAGSHSGIAPESDLIIVKAGDCGSFDDNYVLGTRWIARVAKRRGQPVVINHSLGGHFSAHDGSEPAEQLMNGLSGPGKPGVAITVAAGNEGKFSLHGSGRFGPRRPGQADIDGSQLEIVISPQRTNRHTWLNGYFDSRDDWGLVVRGAGSFLVDHLGRPFNLSVYKIGDEIRVQLPEGVKKPDYFDELAELIVEKTRLARRGEKFDRLWVPLPPGNYLVWGFGATANVQNGSFELYTPFYHQGSFTTGAAKRMMVSSPGNAANVITVGSYDFRSAWENQQGGQTIYNLPLDHISDYSSPGGKLSDGVFKPEIAAPARYAISSMSADAHPDSPACGGSNMGAAAGWTAVTRDGMHMAWSGTSAAAPYVAGVVALMFQKNPHLDAAQIKDILIKTAKRGDSYVGPVPNPEWGYGKLKPAAALSATPPPARAKPRTNKRVTLNNHSPKETTDVSGLHHPHRSLSDR